MQPTFWLILEELEAMKMAAKQNDLDFLNQNLALGLKVFCDPDAAAGQQGAEVPGCFSDILTEANNQYKRKSPQTR